MFKGGSTSIPQDASPVSDRLRHRGGVPGVSDGVPLAGWVQLSAMRARKSVCIGEARASPMCEMPAPGFVDIRDGPSPDQDSTDSLVLGGVSDDH